MSAQADPLSHVASHALLIRPRHFRRDDLAAETNAFMTTPDAPDAELSAAAAKEFEGLVATLDGAGVTLHVVDDERGLPDSVFPNNWFSWHQRPNDPTHAKVVTYPMLLPNRREERGLVDFGAIAEQRSLTIDTHVHFEAHEHEGRDLEGTGSLVLDCASRTAFAAASPRTDPTLVREWCDSLGYTPVLFDALDPAGDPVYHTNVILTLAHGVAMLGAYTIPNPDERKAVLSAVEATGRELVELGPEQIENFAGNALQLKSAGGEPVLAMSARALASLPTEAVVALERRTAIVAPPIPPIENVGGGSVRCMIAELGF